MSNVLCVQPDGGDMQSEEGTEWLMELLTDVQLQQYFMRIRDELNVTRLSHFDYVKNEDLEKIGMGRPGEWGNMLEVCKRSFECWKMNLLFFIFYY